MGANPDIVCTTFKSAVDLISPPPLHDIYSIEDLKQLIYEPVMNENPVCDECEPVSGANIGTVAVGVAKAEQMSFMFR